MYPRFQGDGARGCVCHGKQLWRAIIFQKGNFSAPTDVQPYLAQSFSGNDATNMWIQCHPFAANDCQLWGVTQKAAGQISLSNPLFIETAARRLQLCQDSPTKNQHSDNFTEVPLWLSISCSAFTKRRETYLCCCKKAKFKNIKNINPSRRIYTPAVFVGNLLRWWKCLHWLIQLRAYCKLSRISKCTLRHYLFSPPEVV